MKEILSGTGSSNISSEHMTAKREVRTKKGKRQNSITMTKAITRTDFNFPGQKGIYRGKVRDVYNIDDRYLLMVASDRISAFDVVLPEGIPFKGQVLNQ